MKRITSICILLLILPLICIADTGYKDINVWYGATVTFNGKLFTPTDSNGKTVQPFIYEGTTYMPIRAIIEALGANIEWDANNKVVMITKDREEKKAEEVTEFAKDDIFIEKLDEIDKLITITEYQDSDNEFYNLIIKNISDNNLSITANATYYNSSGKLIGAKSDGVSVLEKGYKTLLEFIRDNNCSYVKFEFDISETNYTKPVQSIINYEVSELSDKVILSVTNNGDENLDLVKADFLFFMEDTIVGKYWTYFISGDGLEVRKTLHEEIYYDEPYDSYLVVFDAAVF